MTRLKIVSGGQTGVDRAALDVGLALNMAIYAQGVSNLSVTGTPASRIGYARVSSVGQNLDSQMDALRAAGCAKIFTDKMTGSRLNRSGWDQMMAYVRPGDTLVVTELSRLTRSLLDLLETAKALRQRRIELVSLRERIDTTSIFGKPRRWQSGSRSDWRYLSIEGGLICQGASAATILSRQCHPANATTSKPTSAHTRTLPVCAGLVGAGKQFRCQLAAGLLFGFQQR